MPTIDPYSTAAVPLWLYFSETCLGHATGFFWNDGGQLYLVTNWHVMTGRDPNTMKHTHFAAGEPDRIAFPARTRRGPKLLYFPLLENGEPAWFVHERLGRGADVAILPVSIPKGAGVTAINTLPMRELKLTVGAPLFVLGFPFDPRGPGGTGFPIWKRATVASEPDLTPATLPYMLVDTASRPGMSGAPVIQRAHGLTLVDAGEQGQLHRPKEFSWPVTRLVGIYSGRLHTNSEIDAQLGMVWPIPLIEEIFRSGRPDTCAAI